MAQALPEQYRAKLDGIVQQMVENGESDDNIQTVVDDFKERYSTTGPQMPVPKALQGLKPSIGERALVNLPSSIASVPRLLTALAPQSQAYEVPSPNAGEPATSYMHRVHEAEPKMPSMFDQVVGPVKAIGNLLMNSGEEFAEDPVGTGVTVLQLLRGGRATGRGVKAGAKAGVEQMKIPGTPQVVAGAGEIATGLGVGLHGQPVAGVMAAADGLRNVLGGLEKRKAFKNPPAPPPPPFGEGRSAGTKLPLKSAPKPKQAKPSPYGEGRSAGTTVSLPSSRQPTTTREAIPEIPVETSQPITSARVPEGRPVLEGVATRERVKPSEGSHLDLSMEAPAKQDYQAAARKTWAAHMDRALRNRGVDANDLGQMTEAQVNSIAKETGLNPASPDKLKILMENITRNPVVKRTFPRSQVREFATANGIDEATAASQLEAQGWKLQ